jgi:hypothetical protein
MTSALVREPSVPDGAAFIMSDVARLTGVRRACTHSRFRRIPIEGRDEWEPAAGRELA